MMQWGHTGDIVVIRWGLNPDSSDGVVLTVRSSFLIL